MSSLKCHIVRDLLPLYIDQTCSDETAREVEEHLCSCPECRRLFEVMSRELPELASDRESREKGTFQQAKRTLLGIAAAMTAVICCLAVNTGGAWMGGPADPVHLAATVLYILFWSLFACFGRRYQPFAKLFYGLSWVTFVSAAVSFCAVILRFGGFILPFLVIPASVPFYGFRLFLGWTGTYGLAAAISFLWVLYACRIRRELRESCTPRD